MVLKTDLLAPAFGTVVVSILVIVEFGLKVCVGLGFSFILRFVSILVIVEFGLKVAPQVLRRHLLKVSILVIVEFGLKGANASKPYLTIIVSILVIVEFGLKVFILLCPIFNVSLFQSLL